VGGEIFLTRPDRPWGPPSLLYNGYRVFPGGKAAGAWRWPPTPSSVKVKERVEPYLFSPLGPWWPVLRELYLYFTFNISSWHCPNIRLSESSQNVRNGKLFFNCRRV